MGKSKYTLFAQMNHPVKTKREVEDFASRIYHTFTEGYDKEQREKKTEVAKAVRENVER